MKKFLLISSLSVLILPLLVLAQEVTTPPLPSDVDILQMMADIANVLFWILLGLSVIFIVYAGFLFVTAGGSSEKIESARNIIMYAAIGIIVALVAYAIRNFLLNYIGW